MTATDKRPYLLPGLADSAQHASQIDFAVGSDCSSTHAQPASSVGNALASTQPSSARATVHPPQGIWQFTSRKHIVVSQRATQKVQKCSVQYRAGNHSLDQPQQLSKKQHMIKNFFANKSAKSALLSIPNQKRPSSRSPAASYVYTVSQRSGPISDEAKQRTSQSPDKPQADSEESHCNSVEGREQDAQQPAKSQRTPRPDETLTDESFVNGNKNDQNASSPCNAARILPDFNAEAKRTDSAVSTNGAGTKHPHADALAGAPKPATPPAPLVFAPASTPLNGFSVQHTVRKPKPDCCSMGKVALKANLAPGAPTMAQMKNAASSKLPLLESVLSTGPSLSSVASQCLSTHKVAPRFAERYTIGDELGSGGFGFVVSAIRHPENIEVAVKFICKDKVPMHAWIKDNNLGLLPIEIYVLKNVDHPGVIRFIEYFEDPRYFYLVMELHGTPWNSRATDQKHLPSKMGRINKETVDDGAKGLTLQAVARASDVADVGIQDFGNAATVAKGAVADTTKARSSAHPLRSPRKGMIRRSSCDLFECIEQHRRFSEENAQYIFAQLVDSVNYLKSMGICHRDLKDENIVIDRNLKVKLVDFGSAVVTTHKRVFHRFYGTISYASPEILRGEPYYADAAEVWSLGVLLYTLLYGEVPFNDPKQAIWDPYTEPKIRISASGVDLLDRLLDKEASKRPDIAAVRKHPWLTSSAKPHAVKQPAAGRNDGRQAPSPGQISPDCSATIHSPVPRPIAPRAHLDRLQGGEESYAREMEEQGHVDKRPDCEKEGGEFGVPSPSVMNSLQLRSDERFDYDKEAGQRLPASLCHDITVKLRVGTVLN